MKTKTKIRAGLIKLNIAGVDGESTDDAHDKWIEVLSYRK